ncbi:A disintegrin and metalloproteinase with thrombospondin motifs 7-like [Octopus sinensis]|uniref:A disintegrin and metalloproteinase with thrombospondin motifs 7-like n=1 Tax=Octopus sinensis TaxID=2607531 RepID=A0A7E6ET05_9MOLL|nr:A disintegrin and metalloproteinase with thrombospondin motifs 7-like [Octopus sinensis]
MGGAERDEVQCGTLAIQLGIKTIPVQKLPPDIQDFVQQSYFLKEGFYSFVIVHPRHEDGGDLRPFHANILKKFTKRELKLHLSIDEESLVIKLTPNVSVLHPNSVVSFADGSKEELVDIKDLKSCYLIGNIISHGGLASFSHCGEILEGAMMINGTEMLVKSLPQHLIHRHRRSAFDQPILIAKRQMNYSTGYIKTDPISPENRESYKKIFKRSEGLTSLTIEIAVYVDSVLTKSLEEEHHLMSLQQKIDFVVIKYNAVQYEYWKEKLSDLHIIIQVKKIVFFVKDPMEHFKEKNLDSILYSFCAWQRFHIPRFDHAMLLSNLGMSHSDKTEECKTPPASHGIMGTLRTGWSICSRKSLLQLIDNNLAECLFEENVKRNEVADTFKSLTLNGLLPGLYLTPDDTCEMNYGPGFRYRGFPKETPNTECKFHSCTYLIHDERFGESKVNYHGIAGAYCGKNKVCLLNLHCVSVETLSLKVPLTIQPGGWGSWNAWSECTSVCGTGIRYRERLCTNPKPLNSPKCQGQQYSSVVCTRKPCSRKQPMHNIIQKAINDLCGHFVKTGILSSKYYSEGTLYGSDKLAVCEVICHSNPRQEIDRFARFGLLPDGTPCEVFESFQDPLRWKKKAICINGACTPVGCDGLLYGKELDRCGICGGDGRTCKRRSYIHYFNAKSNPYLKLKIPKNAIRIKFKFFNAKRQTYQISLFSKDDQPVLNVSTPPTEKSSTPIKFANTYWNYDASSFLMASGPLSEAVIVRVNCTYVDEIVQFKYHYSVSTQKENCELSCNGGGELYECSCLCRKGKGGPECSSCNTVCLNGGIVNEATCECICPSPNMLQPNCQCDQRHAGKDCTGCNYIFCGPYGSYDWESCQCIYEKGLYEKQSVSDGHLCGEGVDQRNMNAAVSPEEAQRFSGN